MQESHLHAAIKNLYTRPGDTQESRVDGYLIDIQQGDLLIEVQTRNFSAIKPKLEILLKNHLVRIVHPIALEKWIIFSPTTDQPAATRRKSPKRGRFVHVFHELARIIPLLAHPNLSIDSLLLREEEIRRTDGKGSWRRKGVSIINHHLVTVVDHKLLLSPDDFRSFLPEQLPQPFTTQDLAKSISIPRPLASKMAYCLRTIGYNQSRWKT
jgi:hypothetical protein